MAYMARHGTARSRPAELVAGTLRVISARMNYWPDGEAADAVLSDPTRAYVARYALGRDYHKVLRARLAQLVDRIAAEVGPFGYRVFTDSAPVLEVALAAKAGLGWRGKHTLLLTREAGSYFFLGEIYTDLPLPVTPATTAHCGTCSACIAACPTRRDRRALRARRAALHFVSHDRAPRRHSGGLAAADRQSRLRLRRLPARLPVEQVRARGGRARLQGRAQRARPGLARRALRMDEGGVRGAPRRQRHPPHRLRAMAAQYRGRAWQRAAQRTRWWRRCSARKDDPSPLVREHVAWALARHAA